MEWLLLILAGLVLLQFVLNPILVKRGPGQPANPDLQSIKPESLDPPVAAVILGNAGVLQSLGFELADLVELRQQAHGAQILFSLLKNGKTQEAALSAFVRMPARAFSYVEFASRFADETSLCTNNNPQLNVTARDPRKRIHQLVHVQDIRRLYAAHGKLTQELTGTTYPQLAWIGKETDYLAEVMRKDYERQVKFGYMFLDTASATYRPTWNGAILMSWRLTWPVSSIRSWWMRTKARATTRRLGV
jgi:hypothetical protein